MSPSSPGRRVLVLGGTAEGRALAGALDAAGLAVTSSLAGRVAAPQRPAGAVRIGGFGGETGLEAELREHGYAAVLDATHPFAERISWMARTACAAAGVPLLRVERPAWTPEAGDDWHRAAGLGEAAAVTPSLGRRVLLTTGRGDLPAFAGATACWFLVRSIEPPDAPFPPRHEVLLARGPFALDDELELLDAHGIDLVVTKDSGGPRAAKLEAARQRGLPVLLVDRPAPLVDVEAVASVDAAVAWALARLSPRG